MQSNPRILIGTLTAILWTAAGIYLLFVVDTLLWRVGALVVIGLGVLRAFIVVGEWKRSRIPREERMRPR